jgi:hypothetical protein
MDPVLLLPFEGGLSEAGHALAAGSKVYGRKTAACRASAVMPAQSPRATASFGVTQGAAHAGATFKRSRATALVRSAGCVSIAGRAGQSLGYLR